MAMMIPDYALVAEVMLFSEGFEDAKSLSRKMVQLYKLASEQLSQQVGAGVRSTTATPWSPPLSLVRPSWPAPLPTLTLPPSDPTPLAPCPPPTACRAGPLRLWHARAQVGAGDGGVAEALQPGPVRGHRAHQGHPRLQHPKVPAGGACARARGCVWVQVCARVRTCVRM